MRCGYHILSRFYSISCVLLSYVLFSTPVMAEEYPTYWGLGWLSTKSDFVPERDLIAKFNKRYRNTPYSATVTDLNDASTGFKLYWGITSTELFDFELGYIDLGEISGSFTANQITGHPVTTLESEAVVKGFYTNVQYTPEIWFEDFELLLRIGIFKWSGKTNSQFINEDEPGGFLGTEENESGYDELIGAGFRYSLNDDYSVRIDFDRFSVSEAEVDMIAVSGQVRF